MPNDALNNATVIGDGAMGTLCSLMLAEHGTRVTLWGVFPEHVAALQRDRENRQFLPGCRFPDSIKVVHEPERALEAPQLIVSAVPCQFMRSVWERMAPHVPADAPIVSVAKGIEVDTLKLPTRIITDCVGQVPVACLSGPSIAPEVAARKPATVVAASNHPGVAELVQETFSTPYFRVYTSADLTGVELAGAMKNVIALAAGICDGIDGGCNAKASLVTRGLVEITRLGVAMGARPETFSGLAGVGDLITTCISRVSRNRSGGEKIGRGLPTEEVIASTQSVIEGIPTTRSVLTLARRHEVEMPIVEAVAAVLFEGRSPSDAIHALMTRRLGAE
jgi:glycerol-3-phosphate dehydrogenase (NAD(P)+)